LTDAAPALMLQRSKQAVERAMGRLAAFGVALVATIARIDAQASAEKDLPSFTVDLAQTSVSGLSSGAYMAGQFQVAFSDTVIGAGIIAGGPYGCAEGQLATALNRCMQTHIGPPDAENLLQRAEGLAQQGAIDPIAGLLGDRVYVFSGTEDDTVTPAVVDQTVAFYRAAGVPEEDIEYVDDVAAGHAFITASHGSACPSTASPYINDCNYDQAGALLNHIYGGLNPPAAEPAGATIAFDQGAFLADPTTHGLAQTGFVYVPQSCAAGAACRVHIAFHGCQQTDQMIGDRFRTETGYSRWADTNDLIVLYPQAARTLANPNACWDWWGYDDAQHATKNGRQMAAVRAMIDRLAGVDPFCGVFSGSNYEHWQAGRASICNFWFVCAEGSGDPIGYMVGSATLYERPQGYFSTQACNG
jgi:poly(3-hydroxybutyrate) depolymerase